MRQGVCAVALAYAANPSFGASRRQDVINHAWRRRRPSVSIEEEDPGGLGCNFFFSKGLLCNLGMYCALSLIPPFLSQKKNKNCRTQFSIFRFIICLLALHSTRRSFPRNFWLPRPDPFRTPSLHSTPPSSPPLLLPSPVPSVSRRRRPPPVFAIHCWLLPQILVRGGGLSIRAVSPISGAAARLPRLSLNPHRAGEQGMPPA